jgi:uncharacterized protein with HEPN domain
VITIAAAKYLGDVQRAAERIARFVAGRSFDDYVADEMPSAAVERQFEIIGEAVARLRRIAPDVFRCFLTQHRSSGFAMC